MIQIIQIWFCFAVGIVAQELVYSAVNAVQHVPAMIGEEIAVTRISETVKATMEMFCLHRPHRPQAQVQVRRQERKESEKAAREGTHREAATTILMMTTSMMIFIKEISRIGQQRRMIFRGISRSKMKAMYRKTKICS